MIGGGRLVGRRYFVFRIKVPVQNRPAWAYLGKRSMQVRFNVARIVRHSMKVIGNMRRRALALGSRPRRTRPCVWQDQKGSSEIWSNGHLNRCSSRGDELNQKVNHRRNTLRRPGELKIDPGTSSSVKALTLLAEHHWTFLAHQKSSALPIHDSRTRASRLSLLGTG